MKTYLSTKGIEIKIKPVSQFKLDAIRNSQEEVPVPLYKSVTVTGEEQEIPMDEVIAKNQGRENEWEEYLTKKKTSLTNYSKLFMEFVIWEGVDCEIPDLQSDWEKTNKRFGIKTPTEIVARKIFYIQNELLGTPDDIGELVSVIFTNSGISEEVVDKLKKSFRTGVSGKGHKQVGNKEGGVEITTNV